MSKKTTRFVPPVQDFIATILIGSLGFVFGAGPVGMRLSLASECAECERLSKIAAILAQIPNSRTKELKSKERRNLEIQESETLNEGAALISKMVQDPTTDKVRWAAIADFIVQTSDRDWGNIVLDTVGSSLEEKKYAPAMLKLQKALIEEKKSKKITRSQSEAIDGAVEFLDGDGTSD